MPGLRRRAPAIRLLILSLTWDGSARGSPARVRSEAWSTESGRQAQLFRATLTMMKLIIRRRPYIIGFLIGLTILIVFLVSASLLTAAQYGTLASTIQAIAVIPAITIAAIALNNDSHDRRVDRVLDFHRELNSGYVQDAMTRLSGHLREHSADGRVRPTSREELKDDQVLSKYRSNQISNPWADAGIIQQFFQRANAARVAETVDLPLTAELVGRSAAWWSLAIKDPGYGISLSPMRELAAWTDEFAAESNDRNPSVREWGQNRHVEFGPSGSSVGEEGPLEKLIEVEKSTTSPTSFNYESTA